MDKNVLFFYSKSIQSNNCVLIYLIKERIIFNKEKFINSKLESI